MTHLRPAKRINEWLARVRSGQTPKTPYRSRISSKIQGDDRSFLPPNAKLAQPLQIVRDQDQRRSRLRQEVAIHALGIRFALHNGLVQTTIVDKLVIPRRNVRFDKKYACLQCRNVMQNVRKLVRNGFAEDNNELRS